MTPPLTQTPSVPLFLFFPSAATPVAETPQQHVRNALMLLILLKDISPGTWSLNPELERAQRRAEAALTMLQHHGPEVFAAHHIQRAIEALLHANLNWKIVDLIPAAMVRLFMAWFPLLKSAEEN